VPVIEIVDAADGGTALDTALRELGSYDWVVVTSPNGAARVREPLRSHDAGRRPSVAVVGPGTEAALGMLADLVAGSSIGEGLVEDFPAGNGRVLLVQAEAARPVVAEGLRRRGWVVDAVVGYRTVAAVPSPALVAEARQADAIVFTSGSTVRHFVSAAGALGIPPLAVSIGPATSAVAEELGVQIAVTATVHNLGGVVEALGSVLAPVPQAAPRPQQRS
jgi:uroporphyrinogen-III synthase